MLTDLADPRPDFLLGVFAHGAGVVKNDVRLLPIVNKPIAHRQQLPSDELRIQHVHLAAERLEVDRATVLLRVFSHVEVGES